MNKYFKQVTLIALLMVNLCTIMANEYHSGEIGESIPLTLTPETDGTHPDLLKSSCKWSIASGYTSAISLSGVQDRAIVAILKYFSGTIKIRCQYKIWNSKDLTKGSLDKNAYFYITCSSQDPNSGGNGGGGSGGGGNGGGGSNDGWNNNDFFQDKTIEGHSMWFFVGTRASDNKHVAIVSPHDAVNSKSCVSQSTTGKVTIPETAKGLPVFSIANASFYGLTEVTEVVIPKSVEYVNTYSFLSCEGLKKITCLAETPPNGPKDLADYGVYFNTILYVPKGCKSKYTSAKGWENFKTIKEIGDPETIDPTGIIVSPSTKTIKVGDTFTATYSLTPSNATTTVKWSSDNSSIASVNENTGEVKGVKVGTTKIWAKTSNDKSDYCVVTVEANTVEPTSITVSPYSKTIKVGGTFTATYTLSPSNATTTVKWSSDNSSIASVNENTGEVKGVKAGTTKIWAKTSNNKTDYCSVTVEANRVEINATNFPDTNFRDYISSYDENKDGVLSENEISKVTSINVYSKDISSLKGIEYFIALNYLNCIGNKLTSLDVSKNTALTELDCYSNQLTALDVSKNTALTILDCGLNKLTSLDVSKNTALTDLNSSSNQLTALDVSKNTALTALRCFENKLTALDVSKNTALTNLRCFENKLTALDVSKNTALRELRCSSNQLTALDVSKNNALEVLRCHENKLTALDVSKNTALTFLSCSLNQLTALDVSRNTKLTYISCCENQIRGSDMDNLIKGLPQNNTNDVYEISLLRETDTEKNVCTKAQVAAIKTKGWFPSYWNGSKWLEYEGFDDTPTAISLPISETVNVGKTITLKPTLTPANANTTLTWESDDTSIAKVSQSGMVMGIKEGTAIISVKTSNNLIAECFVTVVDPSGINEVQLDSPSTTVVYTISGQRIEKPRKGINIVGGKKVVVK